ncbi:uncharacterized protein [Anabrus simplex]|uniref:uncharacterized protein n=1 Tax=Anabrus simplex TaxID=316456 RepID=UPI0035A30D0D
MNQLLVEDIKKRWRGLRDTFRKELKKYNDKRSGSGGDTINEPKWPFFNQLCFLSDTIRPRNMSSSVPDVSEDTGSNEVDAEGTEFETDSTAALFTPHSVENIAGPSQNNDDDDDDVQQVHKQRNKPFKSPLKRGKKRINYDDKLLEIETKKLSYFEQSSKLKQDSDYQFLVSLLPSLQDVPPERKLHVRMKLMNVLVEEQEERNRSVVAMRNISPVSSESSVGSNSAAMYFSHYCP